MNQSRYLSLSLIGGLLLTGCIEDGFTTSPADQPAFSTDTLKMGTLYTLDASPTHRFAVYNRHDKGLTLQSVEFADDEQGIFRMNVDGMSGREFHDVEIRPNDSILVFVEATLPENGATVPVDVLAHIRFVANGVTTDLPVVATGRDAVRLSGETRVEGEGTFEAGRPYLVRDSIVVSPESTLTLEAGVEMYFHSEARMVVYGTLKIMGTPTEPVTLTGDRTGFVAAEIPYELMSGQWGGIEFAPTSRNNFITHASIRNSEYGLRLDSLDISAAEGQPALTVINSVLRNSKGYVIDARFSSLRLAGCELAEASEGILHLVGATHMVNHCTISNNYLFTALGGASVQFEHYTWGDLDNPTPGEWSEMPLLSADFSNSIFYGLGGELSVPDFAGCSVMFRNCLFKSAGSDDDNFLNCLWDADPLFFTDREAYIFDYRLQADSPAAAAGSGELTLPSTSTDMLGNQRPAVAPSLGAYQFVGE